eukprot:590049-Pelagomonas_calceolata.AAC.2
MLDPRDFGCMHGLRQVQHLQVHAEKHSALSSTCLHFESLDITSGRSIHLNVIGVTKEDSKTKSMPFLSSLRAYVFSEKGFFTFVL